MSATARTKRTRVEYQRQLGEFLAAQSCVDCGEDDIRVLEFDHRPGSGKKAAITAMVADLVSWHRIEAEIAKCDVRCANCHRRATGERGQHWRHRWFAAQQGEFDPSARMLRILGSS